MFSTSVSRKTAGQQQVSGYPPSVVLDQPDIYMILNSFNSAQDTTASVSDTYLLSVVVEYIHVLLSHNLTPRQFINELLINLCVKTNK